MACFVLTCNYHSTRKKNSLEHISFHRMPTRDNIRRKWIDAIPRANETWTKHSRICSKHFTQDSFISRGKWCRLKPSAVPSLLLDTNDLPMPTRVLRTLPQNVNKEKVSISMQIDDGPTKPPTRVLQTLPQNVNKERDLLIPMETDDAAPETPNIGLQNLPLNEKDLLIPMDTDDAPTKTPNTGLQNLPLNEKDLSIPMDTDDATTKTSNIGLQNLLLNERADENLQCCPKHKTIICRLKRDLAKAKKLAQKRLVRINTLRKKTQRLKTKNMDLSNRLDELLKNENLEHEKLLMLDAVKNNKVIQTYLLKNQGQQTKEYNLELKKFAVTLHFLSPRAYNYVRDELNYVLPHPKTISKWYRSVNCDPGFTTEAFEAIKLRVEANKGNPVYCAISMDEMAIRKLLEWDGKQYFGHVNAGVDLESDAIPLAREALVFMVTSANDNWKIPVGYFLIDSITAQEKATLLKQCLSLLKETGVKAVSVTFDGAATNKKMCSYLECDMTSLAFYFNYDGQNICMWPDPCHNIKLVRNAFADKRTFIDHKGRTIDWHYIELLNELQNQEGLHLANKLKDEHVNFVKQKMKVRLATQLMSNSVADALEYCKTSDISGLQECDGTIEFIRIFNNLFDILNSRSIRAKGWKRATTTFNIEETELFFEFTIQYIQTLKFSDGSSVIKSNRSTGFVGFMICMKSLLYLYKTLIMPQNSYLKYLCTYKLNQDHIELFFGAIRAQCGFNNNPSARLFRAAYKKLLVHAEFKAGARGNCLPLEEIKVLNYNYTSDRYSRLLNESTSIGRMIENSPGINANVTVAEDHDYAFDPSSLSEYANDVVNYIAGFVVKSLKKKIICETCLQSLENKTSNYLLISIKDRGGLLRPSSSTAKVCKLSEKVLRELKIQVGQKLIGLPKYVTLMIAKVHKIVSVTDVFADLIEHSLENNFEENHRTLLIKSITQCYLNTRIHHITKNVELSKDKIRTYLTKTILFKGQ